MSLVRDESHELTAAQLVEAIPRHRVELVIDAGPFVRAMNALRESFERFGAAFLRSRRREPAPIPLHGFTPNFDLICSVCRVGPEQCNGGRVAVPHSKGKQ